MFPLTIFFDGLSRFLIKLFDSKGATSVQHYEESFGHIPSLIDIGEDEGSVKRSESKIIDNLLKLEKINLTKILTPEPDLFLLPSNITREEAMVLIKDNKPKDLSAIIDQFENMDEKRLVSEILFDDVSSDDPQLIISECFATIKGKLIKDQIKQARIKIRELESSGKDPKEIIIQVTELQKSLQELTENIETD